MVNGHNSYSKPKIVLSENTRRNMYDFIQEDFTGVYQSPKKLFSALGANFIVGISAATLGIYKEVTVWIILPLLLVLLIWYLTLFWNFKQKFRACNLLLFYNYFLFIWCCLLGAYKFLYFGEIRIDAIIVFWAIVLHILLLIISYVLFRRKIFNNNITKQTLHKGGNLLAKVIYGWFVGMTFARIIRNNVTHEMGIIYVAALLVLMSIIGVVGSARFLLKYVILRQYEDRLAGNN